MVIRELVIIFVETFKKNIMANKMTYKEFIDWCDKNDPKSGFSISNQLIDYFIMCNPDRKDLSRADWLDVIIEDYVIIVGREGITIEPMKNDYNKEIILV